MGASLLCVCWYLVRRSPAGLLIFRRLSLVTNSCSSEGLVGVGRVVAAAA